MTDPVALPPHFNNLTRNTPSRGPSVPCIQTSSEAWRAHAAEQRRQLSSESFSATTSSSPNQWTAQSPIELEFGESEKEPEINVNVRPSELRASLMARARRSTQQMQQQRRFSGQSIQRQVIVAVEAVVASSLGSAYDSRLSTRSSISSSISGWASRARSSSQSSQASNDSVNLDALIAEGSDINEECPIVLEDGDDVDDQQQQQEQQQQQQPEQTLLQQQEALFHAARSRTSTIGSDVNMLQYDSHGADEFWDGSDMSGRGTEDEEFDETLREFSQLNMRSSSMCEVRGLGSGSRSRAGTTSSQFADGRNPFDLNADYLDTPMGLRTTKRASTVSNYSTTSSISSTSRLQAPGVTRSAGGAPAPKSGLKAPASRLTQPGARSMLAQPKNTSSTTTTPKSGLTRPSGLQPPRTGLQPPKARSQTTKSGLQPPRAASSSALLSRGPTATKPIANGGAVPGRVSASNTGSRIAPPKGTTSLRTPAKPTATTTNVARPASRSQIVPPGSVKKSTSGIATPNRNSLLPAPSSFSSRTGPTTTAQRGAMKNTNVGRSSSSHSLMTRPPSRVSSSHQSPASSRLTSPTSTHAPHSVLTPPQSPSSKIGSRGNMNGGGIPRSGIAAPTSRLVAPAVSTSRGSRPASPGQLSPGSSSGSQMSSFLPRSHTPTSSRPVSRIPSGLISPRAGRH
ncbi:hypothetical protein BG011_002343 [Mortierella polycephala]|uniref:Uncharacterized protein n=1 Tax=Mortierella polycephala TaxID=41804 RepID=A0A9P6U462_9FUNG|nr:hypothetical protein BG011_002343 [Mortierella polycephala]